MTIRVYCVIDDMPDLMGETIEEQAEGMIRELNYLYDLRGKQSLDVNIIGVESWVSKEAFSKRYDLILIDYGGVGLMTASANANIWKVCQYAEDHPNTLVVLFTGHTAEIYEDELENQFGHLPNVTMRFRRSEMYEHINGTPAFKEIFEQWFDEEIKKAQEQDPHTGEPWSFYGWKIEEIKVPGRK